MFKVYEKQTEVIGKKVWTVITRTDEGINITVAGGDKPHIGAISIVDKAGQVSTTVFPSHKEAVISEKWAKAFYERYQEPVVVSAGIHFDGITKDNIAKVVDECDLLLEKLLKIPMVD